MAAKPVILCGKTEKIATAVIASLKPEFEGTAFDVIITFHFCS
jgi:hypothetical protein